MEYKNLFKQKGFSLIIKIVIICVLLSIVLMTIIIYSKSGDKRKTILEKKTEQKKVINREELITTYKKDLAKLFNNFDGNYENLRDQVSNLVVPGIEYQNFHLNIVIALTSAAEGNNEIAKQRFTDIGSKEENSWFKNELDVIIAKL